MRRPNRLGAAVALGVLEMGLAQPALAGTGADLLLKNFKPQTSSSSASSAPQDRAAAGAPDTGISSVQQFRLDDPFAVEFFTQWNANRSRLSPEINHWAQLYLKAEHEQLLHLWDGIEPQLSSSFRSLAVGARLASLARLGLTQSVVEEWVAAQRSGLRMNELEALVPVWLGSTSWDSMLLERGVILSPELEQEILKSSSLSSLKAFALIRKAGRDVASLKQAISLLSELPAQNRLKLPLAQSVALAHARKGDLGAAALALKEHAEPALEAQKDFSRVSSYLLQIARFLFQAGMWDEAESYLRKIPNSAPEFLTSREELAWILLRKGDVSSLRGEIASLSTDGTQDRFQPELPVVRAISNLKLCSYGAVQNDFADFQATYAPWARRIDQALGSESLIPAPSVPDAFSLQASARVAALRGEVFRLSDLHARSLKTTIPSVIGRQGHWKRLESRMASRLELASKLEQAEFRRQWKNQKILLGEAIRKLRFVKIELLHQVRVAEAEARKGMDVISTQQSGSVRSAPEQVVFPLDGVMWPDEFFQVQSVVESRCLRKRGEK